MRSSSRCDEEAGAGAVGTGSDAESAVADRLVHDLEVAYAGASLATEGTLFSSESSSHEGISFSAKS